MPCVLSEACCVNSARSGSNRFDLNGSHLSVCSTQGGRRYMEDRIHLHCQRDRSGGVEYIFLGVFDGHGGSYASEYAKNSLRLNIVSKPHFNSMDDESILKAIRDGFIETHYAMWKNYENWPKTASGYNSTSGTTASIAIIKNEKLFIGHVGDSGIVLGKRNDPMNPEKVVAECLTVEHKPDSIEEIKRITRDGGEVMNKFGVVRVVWNRPVRGHQGPVRRSTSMEKVPFLAVSRSLGDLWSYNASLDRFVVSPEPQVGCYNLDRKTACIILGSDGLWNVIKPFHAIHILDNAVYRENCLDSIDDNFSQVNYASLLVSEALSRWGHLRADNISAVALLFPTFSVDSNNELKNNHHNFRVAEHPRLILDEVFKSRPSDSILLLNEHTTEILRCGTVKLKFEGASDCSKLPVSIDNTTTAWHDFSGPGYIPVNWHIKKEDDWSIFTSENFEQIFTYQEEYMSCFSDISGVMTPVPPSEDGKGEKSVEESKPQFFLPSSPPGTPRRRNFFAEAFADSQILLPSTSKEKSADDFIIVPHEYTSPPKTSFCYNLRSCSPLLAAARDEDDLMGRPATPSPSSTFVSDALTTSLPFYTLGRHRLTPKIGHTVAVRRSAPHIYARSRIHANLGNINSTASATLIRPHLRRVDIFGRLNDGDKKSRTTPDERFETRLGSRSRSARLLAVEGGDAMATKHYSLRRRISVPNTLPNIKNPSWKIVSGRKQSIASAAKHQRTLPNISISSSLRNKQDFTFSLVKRMRLFTDENSRN